MNTKSVRLSGGARRRHSTKHHKRVSKRKTKHSSKKGTKNGKTRRQKGGADCANFVSSGTNNAPKFTVKICKSIVNEVSSALNTMLTNDKQLTNEQKADIKKISLIMLELVDLGKNVELSKEQAQALGRLSVTVTNLKLT